VVQATQDSADARALMHPVESAPELNGATTVAANRAKRHHVRIKTMNHATAQRPTRHAGWAGVTRAARFATLVLLVLVVGHDLTYLAASGLDGLGIALARSGHGAYWPFTWLVAVAGVMTLIALAAIRAVSLLRRMPGNRVLAVARSGIRSWSAELLRIWPRLALVALLVFVAQEWTEHFVVHGGHVLRPTDFVTGVYAATLPAFAIASLLVAGVSALFRHAIRALEEAVQRVAILPRPGAALPAPVVPRLARIRPSLATPDIGRAPPILLAS
jgi:hypothetical protein